MPWSASGEEWREPWLPLGDTSRNVETQEGDRGSTLEFVRSLVAWRREVGDAPYTTLPSGRGVWAYARGEAACVVNLTGRRATYDGRRLEPWETAIL